MLRYIKGQDFIASPGNSSRVVIPNGRGRWTPFGSLYAKLVYVLMRDLLLRDLSLESGVRKTTLFIVHPCHHTRGGTWKVEITMGLARIPFVCAERRNVMASLGEMVPILARYSYIQCRSWGATQKSEKSSAGNGFGIRNRSVGLTPLQGGAPLTWDNIRRERERGRERSWGDLKKEKTRSVDGSSVCLSLSLYFMAGDAACGPEAAVLPPLEIRRTRPAPIAEQQKASKHPHTHTHTHAGASSHLSRAVAAGERK